MSPESLIAMAKRYDAKSIAYTYSEPTIYFELMLETARLATAEGIKNVMVSNGFMSSRALDMIYPWMDAANIDLKAFREYFYKKYCGGRLAPVLDTIRRMKKYGIWVELTTLLIPGLNSDEEELRELISFILEVDENMPWHVSRFYPQHRLLDVPPTPPHTIYRALDIAAEMGLKFLYAGNIPDDRYSHTHCPSCDTVLVKRSGYFTEIADLSGSKCGSCGTGIPGVW